MESAVTYAAPRQFPAALKLYDRLLDIMPNDPDIRITKARIYQAQGNLAEAARCLSEIDWQTINDQNFIVKITQLRLERNYREAIRLVEARLVQFHFNSQYDKGREQIRLAWIQRFAGDTAGAKATAKQALSAFEQPFKDQSANAQSPRARIAQLAARLSKVYALIRGKGLSDEDSGKCSHALAEHRGSGHRTRPSKRTWP